MIAGLDAVSLIGWIVIFAAGTVWEFKGILDKKRGDTLSETVWRAENVAPVVKWLVAAFLGWLIVHFATGGSFGWLA